MNDWEKFIDYPKALNQCSTLVSFIISQNVLFWYIISFKFADDLFCMQIFRFSVFSPCNWLLVICTRYVKYAWEILYSINSLYFVGVCQTRLLIIFEMLLDCLLQLKNSSLPSLLKPLLYQCRKHIEILYPQTLAEFMQHWYMLTLHLLLR